MGILEVKKGGAIPGPMTVCGAENQMWIKCAEKESESPEGKAKKEHPDRCPWAIKRGTIWQCSNQKVHKRIYSND